jgi:hypothetical protein
VARTFAAVLLFTTAAIPAHAAMRCGAAVITPGDSVIRLLEACGAPTVGSPAVQFGTTFWIYNFGPTEFMRRVTLHDGKVRRIERLERGVVEPAGR